ncbi:hypothetical protein ACHAXR_005303 [Thalassiosira sp. AJA248-18]
MAAIDLSIRRIVITEDEDLNLDKLLLGDTSGAEPPSPPCSSLPSPSPHSPVSPIRALEDEDEDGGCGRWYLPPPAMPGDYLSKSIHKVPSKSILKKTSSYSSFDPLTSSSHSKGGLAKRVSSCLSLNRTDSSIASGRKMASSPLVASGALDSSLSSGAPRRKKQASFLSFASSSSTHSAIGWDMDDSSPGSAGRLTFVPLNDMRKSPIVPGLKSDAGDVLDTDGADRAAGMDSSGGSSRHSGNSSAKMSHNAGMDSSCGSSAKMSRNVSFHSVDVREYDRTVGDNPSCRSGPPMSLDWSYSKKYEKNINEYELERSSDRVSSIKKLHMNKYKRRNVLAFHWGHSEDEMKAARRSTKKIQRRRSMTQMMLPLHIAEEAFSGMKNFVTRKKSDAEKNGDLSDMSNSASTKDSSNRISASQHSVRSSRTT